MDERIIPAADAAPPATAPERDVVIVTGISGSGKSVALHALEDAGYFCVDNLPPELLRDFLRVEAEHGVRRVAIAVDVRTSGSLPHLLPLLASLRDEGVAIRSLFLDADTDTLVRRFSESRRPHPLGKPGADREHALIEAIELERELLAALREVSTVIDTSQLRPALLAAWVRDLVDVAPRGLTLVLESFAFKHGVPRDADFVFDVRVVPNPFYIRELRALTGRDDAVADYLEAQPEAVQMLQDLEAFLLRWLPSFENDQRSYLTVAVGCTGGQHRSVYFVEMLSRRLGGERRRALVRHRELGVLP